jgi:hypothetical protein
MKDEAIILAMAQYDAGCTHKEPCPKYGYVVFPKYLEDHNAVQRVVDGMDWKVLRKYVNTLFNIFKNKKDTPDVQIDNTYKATCRQRCEAILKTIGRWEDVQS